MLRPEFDDIFKVEVTRPLEARGFAVNGKTLDLMVGIHHVSFMRLGGKMTQPSAASCVLCFRHRFLRLVQDGSDASKMRFDVTDFPYKFTLSELRNRQTPLRYHSRLLRFDYDQFDYSSLTATAVKSELMGIRFFILDEFVPWALALPCEQARDEIERFGTAGWCEKRWIEDYDSHLRGGISPR
jgi:hypothetical protein